MLNLTEIFILKSRSGVYQDTPENRRLHRVGMKYGVEKKHEDDKVIKIVNNKVANLISKLAGVRCYISDEVKGNVAVANSKGIYMVQVQGVTPSEAAEKVKRVAGDYSGKLDRKTFDSLLGSVFTIDDEDSWAMAVEELLGDDFEDIIFKDDDDFNINERIFIEAQKLPEERIKALIKEVGINPEGL